MSHHAAAHATEHKHPNYIGIFVLLTVLTIVEVILAYTLIHISVTLTALVLLALSAWKAVLVALYYMHLSDEGTLIWASAITPFFMALLILVAAGGDVTATGFSTPNVKFSQIPSENGLGGGGHHGGAAAHSAPAMAAPRAIAAPAPVSGGAAVASTGGAPAAAPVAGASSAPSYFAGAPGVSFINPDVSFYNK